MTMGLRGLGLLEKSHPSTHGAPDRTVGLSSGATDDRGCGHQFFEQGQRHLA